VTVPKETKDQPSSANGNHADYVESPEPPQTAAEGTIKLDTLIPQVTDVLKVLAWLAVLVFVLFHWSYFGNWLSNATHVELPGVKIDRFVQASVRVEEYASTPNAHQTGFSLEFARAAIVRAERVSPAIRGALVLWVDDHPEHNKLEVEILGDLGIRFVTALSTAEAMERLERDRYDLVISNVGRNESPTPLFSCPVRYFSWQSDEQAKQFNGNLDAFNAKINMTPPGGFSLMEQMREKHVDATPIIFFSASSGGKVATLCSNTITNRVDILLQSVVSHLEETRWQELQNELPSPTQPQH
jgi:CheY-like chemotaxis protein